jgi:hypothetical protein
VVIALYKRHDMVCQRTFYSRCVTAGDGGFVTGNRGKLAKTFSLMFGKDGDAVAALAPPPKVQIDSGLGRLSPIMGVSPKQADAEDVVAGWGDFTSAT